MTKDKESEINRAAQHATVVLTHVMLPVVMSIDVEAAALRLESLTAWPPLEGSNNCYFSLMLSSKHFPSWIQNNDDIC